MAPPAHRVSRLATAINRGKPEKLVPAVIETGATPPILIERFTQIDFTHLEAGLDRLIKQLKLVRRDKSINALTGLPDFSPLFTDFKRRHPDPLPANRFSAEADKVLTNYNKVAPKTIGPLDRKQHVDGILAGLSGRKHDFKGFSRYNALFLGLDPETGLDDKKIDLTTPKLASTLANFNLSDWKLPLATPLPTVEADATIVWNPVAGAASYEVAPLLSIDKTVYRCTEPRYGSALALFPKQFRVRAVGGVFRADSAWSQPVSVAGINLLTASPTNRLPRLLATIAPVLEVDRSNPLTEVLRWSYSLLVTKYVLQRPVHKRFRTPEIAYEGPATEWRGEFRFVTTTRFYRVKGVTSLGTETEWSNVVESG